MHLIVLALFLISFYTAAVCGSKAEMRFKLFDFRFCGRAIYFAL